MAGDLNNFLSFQHTPIGFYSQPQLTAYATNGGYDPQNIASPLPIFDWENPGSNAAWRAYDRVMRVANDVSAETFLVWHRDTIWELSGAWSAVLVIADQDNLLDYGSHTGLYRVTDEFGNELICGLYPVTGQSTTLGWIKYDPRTKTWTRGTISGTGTTINTFAMGKCVPWRGRLWCPAFGSRMLSFDPFAEELFVYEGLGGGAVFDQYAKPVVAHDRLFLASTGSGAPHLLELAFGGVVSLLQIEPEAQSSTQTSGYDHVLWQAAPGDVALWFNWHTPAARPVGGSGGWRTHEFDILFASQPGDVPTYREQIVMPRGIDVDDFDGFAYALSWADGLTVPRLDTRFELFRDFGYQLEQQPRFTPSSGNSDGQSPNSAFQPYMTKYAFAGFFEVPGPSMGGLYGAACKRIDPPGVDPRFGWVHRAGTNDTTRAFAQNTQNWSSSERLWGFGPSPTAFRVEPYSDGSVSRGLLIEFNATHDAAGLIGENVDGQIYLGYGRKLTRPGRRMTLVAGLTDVATFPGGVATFSAGNNQLENVPSGGSVGGTRDRGALSYSNKLGGPFTIGELVEGQTSGFRGVITRDNATANRMHLRSLNGALQVGETLLGLTSGASVTIEPAPSTSNYAELDPQPRYRVIWDLDADGVPDLEWVSIQAVHFRGSGDASRCGMVASSVWHIQIPDPTAFSGETPTTTEGDAGGTVSPDSAATPITTESDAGGTVNPDTTATPATTESDAGGQPSPNTSATPATTESDAGGQAFPFTSETPLTTEGGGQVVPDANLEPNLLRKVPDFPAVRGDGVIGWQANATPIADRPGINHPESAQLISQVWEGYPGTGAPGPRIRKVLDGMVLLGSSGPIDAENDAPGTRYPILDMTGSGLDREEPAGGVLQASSFQGAGVLRIVARAISVSAVTVQPQVGLGLTGTYDDQAAQQALVLAADTDVQELVVAQGRNLMLAGDVLEAELDQQATVTGNYLFEILVYGFHRRGPR